jgi:hypothetical protein
VPLGQQLIVAAIQSMVMEVHNNLHETNISSHEANSSHMLIKRINPRQYDAPHLQPFHCSVSNSFNGDGGDPKVKMKQTATICRLNTSIQDNMMHCHVTDKQSIHSGVCQCDQIHHGVCQSIHQIHSVNPTGDCTYNQSIRRPTYHV